MSQLFLSVMSSVEDTDLLSASALLSVKAAIGRREAIAGVTAVRGVPKHLCQHRHVFEKVLDLPEAAGCLRTECERLAKRGVSTTFTARV